MTGSPQFRRWWRATASGALAAAGVASGAACAGVQSSLDTRGPAAASIARLWWVLFGLGTASFVAVCVLLALALRRGRRRVREGGAALGVSSGAPSEAPSGGGGPESSLGRRLVTWGGVVVPLLVLLVVVVASVATGAALRAPRGARADALTVQVVAHQFWWEVRYPHLGVVTANELHIPAGRPVRVQVTTEDVIHSFWVPNLHGKVDMLPGRTNQLWLQADSAGRFRGQCAEFCGTQHTMMGMHVVAHDSAAFVAWAARERAPAPSPADPLLLRGQQVFLGSACVYCHAVRGTNASSRLGPDLTHLAARATLGAAVVPNTPGNLAAWIVDPQALKPGNKMPPSNIAGPELQALVAYLESLR